MGPLLVLLAVACAVLVVATGALTVALVRLRRRSAAVERGREADLADLRRRLDELATRQHELAAGSPASADYVITLDPPEPVQVPTQRVVGTTLGEPLIKAAALGHGVRLALREDRRAHLLYQVRREYRRRRRASRATARAAMRRAR